MVSKSVAEHVDSTLSKGFVQVWMRDLQNKTIPQLALGLVIVGA